MATNEPLTLDALHQYAYCPRRMHLMHVDGRWESNIFTDQGRSAHKRVDDADDALPAPPTEGGDEPPVVARSVSLGSEALGLSAKLDLIDIDGSTAVPVETKRGSPPDNPLHSYEPERVQLMAQGMLLREHGYASHHGVLYFAHARHRVHVDFTIELEARTRLLLAEANAAAQRIEHPAPLDDSPKCHGCSLAGICLPDETRVLSDPDKPLADVRRLYPARDDALPLYIQEQGTRVGKSGEAIEVTRGGQSAGRFPLKDVSQLVLCGAISVTPAALHWLCENGVPIVHISMGGWFYGITQGMGLRNAYDRAAQFAAAADDGRRIRFAREVVRAKTQNQRTLLRRNAGAQADDALENMRRQILHIDAAADCDSLLGIEGILAAIYFGGFSLMLTAAPFATSFADAGRNRRPPRDPVNAMLSFGYALLAKECTVALLAEGLDPWWGLYHRPRHGRPALALDMMEEFRPLIVDSAVLSAVNTGMVAENDFVQAAGGCSMKPAGRKAFIRAYEARLDQLITHPVFDYRCSWRAVVRLQARLLAKWLRGDVPTYTGITTR